MRRAAIIILLAVLIAGLVVLGLKLRQSPEPAETSTVLTPMGQAPDTSEDSRDPSAQLSRPTMNPAASPDADPDAETARPPASAPPSSEPDAVATDVRPSTHAEEYARVERSVRAVIHDTYGAAYRRMDAALFASAFWKDDYVYWTDFGTANESDDRTIYWGEELASAERWFGRAQYIELNMPSGELAWDPDDAGVAWYRTTYRILHRLDGDREPTSANGAIMFNLTRRHDEWRISGIEDLPSRLPSES